jgi:AcrR family transcriptional regulator
MSATNTKERIVKNAKELFKTQGYAGTSVKQIAETTGCTAPALYYFFAGGKVDILREVVEALQINPAILLKDIQKADSLDNLVNLINKHLPSALQHVLTNVEWKFVQNIPVSFYRFMFDEVSRFIPNKDEARKFTWFVFCAHAGYMELFMWFHLDKYESYQLLEFTNSIMEVYKHKNLVKNLVQP